ncbi:MAG: hypothetical protein K0Q52_1125 [Microbacterium sp.]|jgi:DNA-binding NarL/FixJ family response regulator|nr:hypothetical protein [Microbacterium sp.]
MTVSVVVKLPDDVYLALMKIADRHETQVHALIAARVTSSIRNARPAKKSRSKEGARRYTRSTPHLLEQVATLNGRGMSDTAIAEQLGVGQPTVSAWRRGLGLKSPSTYARREPGAAS